MPSPQLSPPTPERLLHDLGKRLGIEGLAFSAEGVCELVFDKSLRTVTLYGGGQWISAVQLEPHPLPDIEAAELVLRANFLWRATHGATLALDSERRLWAQKAVAPEGAEAGCLLANLETLLDLAEAWRSRSRAFATPTQNEPAAPLSMFLNRA